MKTDILAHFSLSTEGAFAIAQRNHVTMGLVLLNWVLIADAIAVLVVGTIIWFFSLQQRNNYFAVYKSVSAQTRIQIQDKVRWSCICSGFAI